MNNQQLNLMMQDGNGWTLVCSYLPFPPPLTGFSLDDSTDKEYLEDVSKWRETYVPKSFLIMLSATFSHALITFPLNLTETFHNKCICVSQLDCNHFSSIIYNKPFPFCNYTLYYLRQVLRLAPSLCSQVKKRLTPGVSRGSGV